MKRFLSLGAGVQSTTLYLMAELGLLGEKPEAAIFADTGFEPQRVYDYLDYLKKLNLSIPIIVVSGGNLLEDVIRNATTGSGFASVPFYTPSNGREAMLRRQCTREYKVTPITKKLRELMGYLPRQRIKEKCELWIGISMDEIMRAKPNREHWIENTWPLIDKRMTREQCKEWLEKCGFPEPPKSACIGCPYHDNAMWRDMKENHPEEFEEAVKFERIVHNGIKGTKGKMYLHRSLQMIDEVDFRNAEDLGQLNFFNNECEGMCGV